MATTAITYRTGYSAGNLRTVLVDDAKRSVVLVPDGRLEIMTGKLLHGTSCRHEFWDQELGTEGDDFAVPASSVVQTRDMLIATKARHK